MNNFAFLEKKIGEITMNKKNILMLFFYIQLFILFT